MSQEHADNIVAWALQTGRNPLDTAGMDSSDEDWLGQNSEWEDYIMDEWKNKKTNQKTKYSCSSSIGSEKTSSTSRSDLRLSTSF